MAGTPNPRRVMLADMRKALDFLRTMVSIWSSPPSTRWYADEPGGVMRWHQPDERRKRAEIPAAEYQENNPERLSQLILYMQAVQNVARKVELAAQDRLGELEREKNAS